MLYSICGYTFKILNFSCTGLSNTHYPTNPQISCFLRQGFMRVFDDMADIVLDVPLAYIILDRFVERCNRAGFLTDKIINNVPSR